MANKIPVYVFTGFLEGGKTHIIQESMEDQRFNSGEKTLLIMCEEGIEELDLDRFWGKNVYLELLDDPEMLTRDYLTLLYKKHKIDRVIIEYNGMWLLSKLYAALPADWFIFQNMMFADAATFINYNANMRSLMVDKLAACEMIVLNRTPENINKDEIHKIIRGINRRAAITYDYPDGHVEYDDIEDPLPFDINAPVIEIADEDYAVWYRDMIEELDKYAGKTVKFKGIVVKDTKMPQNSIAVGRHVMTCCADDIAYQGLACVFDGEMPNLKTRNWITVTAVIRLENHSLYRGHGPVLHALRTDFAVPPKQEVATFY
jgi:hypothetical protein